MKQPDRDGNHKRLVDLVCNAQHSSGHSVAEGGRSTEGYGQRSVTAASRGGGW